MILRAGFLSSTLSRHSGEVQDAATLLVALVEFEGHREVSVSHRGTVGSGRPRSRDCNQLSSSHSFARFVQLTAPRSEAPARAGRPLEFALILRGPAKKCPQPLARVEAKHPGRALALDMEAAQPLQGHA